MVSGYFRGQGRRPPESALSRRHRYRPSSGSWKCSLSSHICPWGSFLGQRGQEGLCVFTFPPSPPRLSAWPLGHTHLLQLLVLPVHEGLPVLKELALRPLEVLERALPLDGAVLHGDDLERQKQTQPGAEREGGVVVTPPPQQGVCDGPAHIRSPPQLAAGFPTAVLTDLLPGFRGLYFWGGLPLRGCPRVAKRVCKANWCILVKRSGSSLGSHQGQLFSHTQQLIARYA